MKYLLSLVLILSVSWAQAQSDYNHKKGYSIGDVATDFSLKNIDGQMVSLESLGEVNGYIIVFTCNHCPYAVMYEDRLNALNTKYAAKGYPIVAINPNDPEVKPSDSYDNMIVRANEKGFEFPYLLDAGQHVFPMYGATKTPHVFLLNKERVVKYIGAIDNNPRDASDVSKTYLEDAVEALRNGDSPNPSVTKAIGCSIKVKS